MTDVMNQVDSADKGLQIKRVYDAPSEADGFRVLVDRLWPRGLSRERVKFDEWIRELSPTPSLRRWFSHAPERFDYFRERYLAQLDDGEGNAERAASIIRQAEQRRVTLLYGAKDPVHNHAVVLEEWLRRQAEGLSGEQATILKTGSRS
ncbi:DUF488 domain-containing protein [Saccharibacillus endophyticus]|uniref:DUF488 family protein n=1 Tax=Saccharibacillus endophyticus TaxID=2060666 RepID=A0ABQ1ZMN4_9BACL|nr:DUF488 family protein [Saccharibacillus endophyticus]GGH69358.1 hypothetical protein GCM10007362_04340 [Saccharibacillus endophyticus]